MCLYFVNIVWGFVFGEHPVGGRGVISRGGLIQTDQSLKAKAHNNNFSAPVAPQQITRFGIDDQLSTAVALCCLASTSAARSPASACAPVG